MDFRNFRKERAYFYFVKGFKKLTLNLREICWGMGPLAQRTAVLPLIGHMPCARYCAKSFTHLAHLIIPVL